MSRWINFEFLAILNLFVLLLWPASGTYGGTRKDVMGVMVLIITIIAVILDIVFIVLHVAA